MQWAGRHFTILRAMALFAVAAIITRGLGPLQHLYNTKQAKGIERLSPDIPDLDPPDGGVCIYNCISSI